MKTCPTCKKLCIDQAVQCPKCKNLLTVKANSNRPHQTAPKRFSFGKMLMYILLTCWTIYFLEGIRQNYKTYSLLAWIIVISVASIPFIVFYCCLRSNKNKLTKHLPAYTNISDNLYADTPQIEPQGEIVQTSMYQETNTLKSITAQHFVKMQNDNIVRIISESADIVDHTKNIGTFFSRYALMIDKAYDYSGKRKVALRFIHTVNFELPQRLNSCVSRALADIDKLQTVKAKINRIKIIVNALDEQSRLYVKFQNVIFEQIGILNTKIVAYDKPSTSLPEKFSDSLLESTYVETKIEYTGPIKGVAIDDSMNLDEKVSAFRQQAKHTSDLLYAQRTKIVNGFNPEGIVPTKQSSADLSSVEKSFLKYMKGKPIVDTDVPAYWFYEYNIDYPKLMTKLLQGGYLYVSGVADDLSVLKVEQLKLILKGKGLSCTGKKDELISSIIANYSREEINIFCQGSNINKQVYLLTAKGSARISGICKSMTKDIDFEDKCLNKILTLDFSGAYDIVRGWQLSKHTPFEDDNSYYKNPLPEFDVDLYNYFFNQSCSEFLTNGTVCFEPEFKASIVLGIMLGTDVTKIWALFVRLTGIDLREKAVLSQALQNTQFALMNAKQNHSFHVLMA